MSEDREYDRAVEAAEEKARVEIFADADGNPVANVVWDLWISDGVVRKGETEGPMTVPEALRRADEVVGLYDLTGVVISTSDDRFWQPEWGILRPHASSSENPDESVTDVEGGEVPTRQWI